jgi:hypothetical protein
LQRIDFRISAFLPTQQSGEKDGGNRWAVVLINCLQAQDAVKCPKCNKCALFLKDTAAVDRATVDFVGKTVELELKEKDPKLAEYVPLLCFLS